MPPLLLQSMTFLEGQPKECQDQTDIHFLKVYTNLVCFDKDKEVSYTALDHSFTALASSFRTEY